MSDRAQTITLQIVGIIGSITAWAGVLNIIATGLAIAVSACTLVIIAPKAASEIRKRFRK